MPFTLAVGAAGGFFGRGLYDDFTAPKPLQIGDHFRAAVTDVYDADTMTLVDGEQIHKARIWGIDAPERSQRCLDGEDIIKCGLQARDELREMVMNETVKCEVKGFDDNRDRPVVQCKLDGKDPIATLVRDGWAFSDKKYSDDPYKNEQEEAQENKSGVWGMDIMEPAAWRGCQASNRGGVNPAECWKPLGPNNPPGGPK